MPSDSASPHAPGAPHRASSPLARERDAYRRQLETIAENASLALFIMDERQQCTYMNPAAERLTGYSLAETRGRALHDVVHHTRPDGTPYPLAECPIDRALPQNMRERGTETFVHKDGSFYPVAFTASPIRQDGRTVGTIIEVRDIREDLRRVQASQLHLLGLINEMLNYARLETGSVSFETTEVPLDGVLAEAEALVTPQALAKGLALEVAECPAGLLARADAEKLRQILVNLLSNAVKFTDARDGCPGRIDLSCAADGTTAVVRVRDTGIGIAADKLSVIFDPFVQVRADLTRTAEGTGLGLAISRDLARAMGGDLTVESTPGVGSTFTITLPRA